MSTDDRVSTLALRRDEAEMTMMTMRMSHRSSTLGERRGEWLLDSPATALVRRCIGEERTGTVCV